MLAGVRQRVVDPGENYFNGCSHASFHKKREMLIFDTPLLLRRRNLAGNPVKKLTLQPTK